MKVAVTGATGLIGKKVVEKLKAENIEVIALTRSHREMAQYVLTDYSISSLCDIISEADAIVHLAATRGESKNSFSSYQVNVEVTENILKSMTLLQKCKHIIYLSSISVYSDSTLLPWRESSAANPVNYYGLSKLACEHMCRIYGNSGITYTVFRCAHVLGIENNRYMVSKFIASAFNHEMLCVQGKSIAKREFIYVKDVANAVLWALKSKNAINQVFNLGYGEGYTNYQIATMINTSFNNINNLEYVIKKDEKIQSSYMDVQKIYQAGYKAEFTVEQAVDDIFEEYCRQHCKDR